MIKLREQYILGMFCLFPKLLSHLFSEPLKKIEI